MVIPSSVHRDVIFVVDSSARLSGVLPSLLKEYIQPCIEYFGGGKLPEVTYGLQSGPVRYGLITINPPATTYCPVCTYYPITCSPARLIKWIQDIRLEGGMLGNSLLLSEGLAAVLELAQMMESTRESCLSPDVTVEKHCILVLNQAPSPHPCVESLRHAGKTPPQLVKQLVEGSVHVSVISPRSIPAIRDLVEKVLPSTDSESTPLDEIDHSLHEGHLVLFQGFQIPSIKEKKRALQEVKMETAEQPATGEVAMDTSSPAVKEEPPTTDISVKNEPSVMGTDSTLPLPTGTSIKQEPSSVPTTSTPLPFPPIKMVVAGQASVQVLPASGAASGSSTNPIQISSPVSLPDQPFSTALSQSPITSLVGNPASSQSALPIKSESSLPYSTLAVSQSTPASAQSSPFTAQSTPQSSPFVAQSTPASAQSSPFVAQSTPQSSPFITQSTPASAQSSPFVAQSTPQSTPFIAQSTPASAQSSPFVAQSTPASAQNSPFVASSQSLVRTTSGGIPSSSANLEKAMIAAKMAIMMASGQSSSNPPQRPAPMTGVQPQIKTEGPAIGAQPIVGMGQNPPVQVASGVPQGGGPGRAIGRVPTPPIASSGIMSQVPSSSIQTSSSQVPQNVLPAGQPVGMPPSQQPPLQPQVPQQPITIWKGIMELAETHDNQRQMRQIACLVTAARRDIIQELQPNTWPQKMTMNAYPKAMFNSIMIGMDFNKGNKNLKTVNFQFQDNPQSVTMLRQLMIIDTAVKSFAIVHLVGTNTACPIKALVLVWNEKQKQFTGLIPLEQEKFVNVVKQVLILRQKQQQMQQAGLQQLNPGYQTNAQAMSQGSMGQHQSFSQPSSLQQTQMSVASLSTASHQTQGPNVGMIGQQGQGGLMAQQQQQGGMMGQQSQTQAQAAMMNQATPAQGGMMGQQQQKTQAGMLAQQQGQGIIGQQQQQGQGLMGGQQQGQGMLGQQQQGQGLMGGQQQGQGMLGQQQQGQGLMGQQQQQGQGMMGQQQQGQGMMGQQQQGQALMGGQQQQQGQGLMGQQQGQGMMGQQQGQGMIGQLSKVGMQTQGQQQQQQQTFAQGGMIGQQQGTAGMQQPQHQPQAEKQAQLEKILRALIQVKPEQQEVLFQRIRATTPEQKQQWLTRANQFKQQLIQQQSQANRMMISGGVQQGSVGRGGPMQQLQPRPIGRSMPMNQGQVYNRPGVPQSMGPGIRPTNVIPPQQQQQQQHLPPGYNQWQS